MSPSNIKAAGDALDRLIDQTFGDARLVAAADQPRNEEEPRRGMEGVHASASCETGPPKAPATIVQLIVARYADGDTDIRAAWTNEKIADLPEDWANLIASHREETKIAGPLTDCAVAFGVVTVELAEERIVAAFERAGRTAA